MNQQWLYRSAPDSAVPGAGVVGPSNYEMVRTPMGQDLNDGEVLIAARFISVDPYMRINQSSKNTWTEPHALNAVQGAAVVAQVLRSNAQGYATNDWVLSYSGWQTHAKVHVSALTKIDASVAPVSTALGVLGMPGRTAWFGLMEAGQPRAGEVVAVSGAAGAVGSLVVQFAKMQGAKVLAIAGSDAKCAWLKQRLGADFVLNYKSYADRNALSAAMHALVGGVDVYFDNVGGSVSDAVMPLINRRARIVICGQMSQYSTGLETPELGPRFLHHILYQRATIQGILARDYTHRMDEMTRIVAPMVQAGKILFEETVIDGFERLPAALNQLFTGSQTGKLLVRVLADNDYESRNT
jgi:NADPH-dependent curcumin reductase CurA